MALPLPSVSNAPLGDVTTVTVNISKACELLLVSSGEWSYEDQNVIQQHAVRANLICGGSNLLTP